MIVLFAVLMFVTGLIVGNLITAAYFKRPRFRSFEDRESFEKFMGWRS